MSRWSVAYGGYPDGWEPPFCQTDDPNVAMAAYESAETGHMQTVAIFDDNGEGEPLDPHAVEEILDAEHAAWEQEMAEYHGYTSGTDFDC